MRTMAQRQVALNQRRLYHKRQAILCQLPHQETQTVGTQKQADLSVMFALSTTAIRLLVLIEATFVTKKKVQKVMHLFAQKQLLPIVTKQKDVRRVHQQRQVVTSLKQRVVRNVAIRHQAVAIAVTKAKLVAAVAIAAAATKAATALTKEVHQVVAAKATIIAVVQVVNQQEVARQHLRQVVAKAAVLLEDRHRLAEVVEINKKCYFCFSFL